MPSSCLAAETRRAYTRAWAGWRAWCLLRDCAVSPIDDAELTAYLTARLHAGATPATIRKDLAGILAAHVEQFGLGADAPAARALVRGLDCRPRTQAVPLDWRAVDLVAELTRRAGDDRAIRDAALLRVGSDGLMRVSELEDMLTTDLQERGQSMTATVRSRKTRSVREVYLGAPTARLVREWLLQSGGRADRRAALWSLKADTIARIIRRRAAAAGIPRASGHSLRVGAAQSLAEAGASLVDMQLAGGWASPAMPAHYARGALAERGAVARLRYRSLAAAIEPIEA